METTRNYSTFAKRQMRRRRNGGPCTTKVASGDLWYSRKRVTNWSLLWKSILLWNISNFEHSLRIRQDTDTCSFYS